MTESLFASVLAGAAIPAGVHGLTFAVLRRYAARDPMKILKANVLTFGIQLVLYGAIIAAVVSWMSLRMWAFIISFVGVFVLLHILEAVYFKRLLLNRKIR